MTIGTINKTVLSNSNHIRNIFYKNILPFVNIKKVVIQLQKLFILFSLVIQFIGVLGSSVSYSLTSGPLFGLWGTGGGQIDGLHGLTISGTGFVSVDLDSSPGYPTTLGQASNTYIASTVAYDPATHNMYMQQVRSDGTYLIAVNTRTGQTRDILRLTTIFKTFVFDPITRRLFGLAGPGGGGSDGIHGIFLSGTGFAYVDLRTDNPAQPQMLKTSSDAYIITATAFNPINHTMYVQRMAMQNGIPSGPTYLVSINTITGEQTDIAPLAIPYKTFVFDPGTNSLFGLKGLLKGIEPVHGLTISGNTFNSFNLTTRTEEILNSVIGDYIATSISLDTISHTTYMQKVESDGSHLVSVDTILGQENDIALMEYPIKTLVITNPPPSQLTLAKICYNTYYYGNSGQSPTDVDGYKCVLVPGSSGGSFYALVYQNDRQVVVAFRGTELGIDTSTTVKDLLADRSFITGNPTSVLISKVQQAVTLLKNTSQQIQKVNITLTGHSLGGAIAQILGNHTGLPTMVFNAPRSGALLDQLKPLLLPLPNFNNFGPDMALRMYGDIISVVGSPIEYSYPVTIDTQNSLKPHVGTWTATVFHHGIDWLILQLQAGAAQTLGEIGPVANVLNLITGFVVSPGNTKFKFKVSEAAIAYGMDPSPASEYTFLGDPGSPTFTSVSFPYLNDVSSYGVSALMNGTWGPPITASPLTPLGFGTPTSGFKFWALDSSGKRMKMPGSFIFDVTFSTTGTFTGTLSASQNRIFPAIKLLLLD